MIYLAYGSNLNFKQMKRRCPKAKPIFIINGQKINQLNGWRLVFNRYANIVRDPNSYVPVGLWYITKNCEKKLDIYEDFPNLYSKISINILSIKTMTYIMNSRKILKPSKTYFDIICKGYANFKLDTNYLEKFKF